MPPDASVAACLTPIKSPALTRGTRRRTGRASTTIRCQTNMFASRLLLLLVVVAQFSLLVSARWPPPFGGWAAWSQPKQQPSKSTSTPPAPAQTPEKPVTSPRPSQGPATNTTKPVPSPPGNVTLSGSPKPAVVQVTNPYTPIQPSYNRPSPSKQPIRPASSCNKWKTGQLC